MRKRLAVTGVATGMAVALWGGALGSGTSRADDLLPIVRIPRGGQFTLPMEGITRVVPDDDEVARGHFSNGHAVLEGVTLGDTTIEVYGRNNKRQVLSVQVVEPTGDSTGETRLAAAPSERPIDSSGQPLPSLGSSVTVPVMGDSAIATGPAIAVAPGGSGPVMNGGSPGTSSSNLSISLRVSPPEDNPSQALVTLTFGNRGATAARGVKVRYALDDAVSYVTGSATGNARYDAAARELVWDIGTLPAGAIAQSASFRVEPIDRTTTTFNSGAIIEQEGSNDSLASNTMRYFFSRAPLLTVFALPDRFLAGRNAPVLVDVRGEEALQAIDRLQRMGVISGVSPGLFKPAKSTGRAEYVVMMLNGLNLRDLRDITAIKFVLGRRSTVNLVIKDARGKVVTNLIKNATYEVGEHTQVWDGRAGDGYAPAGRYTYECTARDQTRGETTRLRGTVTIVPQTPLNPVGLPTFNDIKASDWYAGYLSVAEKQNLVQGYPGNLFRPEKSVSRVEATAIIVRALGLEDLARQQQGRDSGFLDYQSIPTWAIGYVNVATGGTVRSAGGSLIVGYPGNTFIPNNALRRDEAALIVQRLIDKETTRRMPVSGQLQPGATITIDNRTVRADDQGHFDFVLDQSNTQPTTVVVLDMRG